MPRKTGNGAIESGGHSPHWSDANWHLALFESAANDGVSFSVQTVKIVAQECYHPYGGTIDRSTLEPEVIKVGKPLIGRLKPGKGSRGATISVDIIGDGMTGVLTCDMGTGIVIQSLKVGGDGNVEVVIAISSEADLGKRDVTLTKELPHETDTLKDGFQVE